MSYMLQMPVNDLQYVWCFSLKKEIGNLTIAFEMDMITGTVDKFLKQITKVHKSIYNGIGVRKGMRKPTRKALMLPFAWEEDSINPNYVA